MTDMNDLLGRLYNWKFDSAAVYAEELYHQNRITKEAKDLIFTLAKKWGNIGAYAPERAHYDIQLKITNILKKLNYRYSSKTDSYIPTSKQGLLIYRKQQQEQRKINQVQTTLRQRQESQWKKEGCCLINVSRSNHSSGREGKILKSELSNYLLGIQKWTNEINKEPIQITIHYNNGRLKKQFIMKPNKQKIKTPASGRFSGELGGVF
jgi:hypothetical protein